VTPHIAAIVEGYSEAESVPLLIRRIGLQLDPPLFPKVVKPIRQSRYKIIKPGELEIAIELAILKLGTPGAIFVLLDADDDCPATLGPALLARAVACRPDVPIGIVIANREFESWFLAAAGSLAGKRGLPTDLQNHPSPETPRDAKSWLSKHMGSYSETLDQPKLTDALDLDVAQQRARSFEKCHREISRLIRLADEISTKS
jgi:Domain of unknown function (DUF4276)